MQKLLPIFILIFSVTVIAQTDEPVAGKIDDLKGLTKVFLVARSKKVRGSMIGVLKSGKAKLDVADNPEAAQFFLELKIFRQKKNTSNVETIELTAYFYNAEKQKVIVWSEAKAFLIGTEGAALPALALTRKFLKDLNVGKFEEK